MCNISLKIVAHTQNSLRNLWKHFWGRVCCSSMIYDNVILVITIIPKTQWELKVILYKLFMLLCLLYIWYFCGMTWTELINIPETKICFPLPVHWQEVVQRETEKEKQVIMKHADLRKEETISEQVWWRCLLTFKNGGGFLPNFSLNRVWASAFFVRQWEPD